MKTIKLILIAMAAPALAVLGFQKIGETPVLRGYDSGFSWKADPSKGLVLSVDADGNMSCWVLLKIPTSSLAFTAETSSGSRLRSYRDRTEGNDQWIVIARDGGAPHSAFEWVAGETLFLRPQDLTQTSLVLDDWYVYLNNKSYDSQKRAKWRRIAFYVYVPLFGLFLCGVILEAIDRVQERTRDAEPLTPQLCLQRLIRSVDGVNETQAEQMRTVLQNVLIHGVNARDALATLQLTPVQKAKFWFATASQFRSRLQYMIDELDRYLVRLLTLP